MKVKELLRITIALPLIAIVFSNCGTIKKSSILVKDSDSIKIGYSQVKVLLYTFYNTFSSTTEESANYILHNTEDKEIKKMALRWKINSISEARKSWSIPDPYASLIDIRAYCYQLNQFFDTGAGSNYFDEYQYVAVEATEKLVKEIDKIALLTISQARFDKNQPEFLKWVSEHPITGSEFFRESTVSLFVEYIGDDSQNLSSSIGSIEEALTDIRSRLNVYSQSLPKQAQWQSELVIQETLERRELKDALSDLDSIALSLDGINKSVLELDMLLGNVLNDAFREVDRQRLATLNELKSERELIVNLLQTERQIVLDAISIERQKTIDDAEKLSSGLLSSTGNIMYDIVDHVFYRLLQFSAILGIALVAGIIVMKRIKKA